MDASDVRSQWATRTGEFSPRYYAYYGPDELSDALLAALEVRTRRRDSILELGCSSGRHLSHLHDNGYRSLAGVEINADALSVMRAEYPDVAESATVFADAIETVVADLDDDAYDVVYSVQTLQHLHGDVEWVFERIRRVAASVIVTVEIEGQDRREGDEILVRDVDDGLPLTYRNWRTVFEAGAFEQTHSERVDESTLRVFERRSD